MTEARTRRHGLEPFLDDAPQGAAGQDAIEIQIQSGLVHLNLRGNPGDSRFMDAAEKVLGQALPTEPNTSSSGAHRICWLGPDEWLILTNADTLAGRLRETLTGVHAALNDVSGGQIALRVAGRHAADVLAKGCTVDFHPRVFRPGMCAQSGLAKASVLIGLIDRTDRQPVFEIVVRRSFSDYLLRWLGRAAAEFGAAFSAS